MKGQVKPFYCCLGYKVRHRSGCKVLAGTLPLPSILIMSVLLVTFHVLEKKLFTLHSRVFGCYMTCNVSEAGPHGLMYLNSLRPQLVEVLGKDQHLWSC